MSTDKLVAVDLFAGAGGFSTGFAKACEELGLEPGRDVELHAINHDENAIATHERNHSWANHYRAKVEALHPPDVATDVDLLIAGPSCTHFSAARGGQPVEEQERASPWHVLRWVELQQPKHLLIENVGELRSWGPVVDGEPTRDGSIYTRWVEMLETLGYTIIRDDKGRYGVTLRAADYGDPTTRKRLFVMGSRVNQPTPPEPTHSDDPTDDLENWVPAREVIDWSDRGESLFTRSRPLSETTMKRIAKGIRDYCDERLHPYADALELFTKSDITDLQDDVVPVDQIEAEIDDRSEPFLVSGTVAVDDQGATTPMVMGQHGGAIPRNAVTEPVPTVAKRGAIHFIEAQAFVLPRNGSARGTHSNPAYPPEDRPFHTVTAKNHDGRLFTPFLVQYNGDPEYSAKSIDDPLPTLTKRARYALIDPAVYPFGMDLRYRMLDPPETKQAQGFPEDYEITGSTKRDKRKQIGNAVPVNLAKALVSHVLADETPSLSTYGGGIQAAPDAEVPEYTEVISDD